MFPPSRTTASPEAIREISRAGRFAAVGIAATLIHAGIYLLLVGGAVAMPLAANAAGFLIAFTFSFVAQYGWTFGDRTRGLGRSARQAARLRFLAVAVMGFALNASFVALVEARPDADPRAAAVFMIFVTPIVTFLLLKHWALGKSAVRLDQEKSVRRTGASIFRARDRGWMLPLLAVLAVTPLLASSVFFGLPQSLDPDEGIFMGKALRMLAERSPDPAWYGAPAQPLMYALGPVYACYILVLDQLGIIASLSDAGRFYFDDQSGFLVLGRLVSAVSTAGCLLVMVAILREVRVAIPAILWAIVAFAFSPLVLSYSSIIRMDFQQVFFNLLTVYFCLLATRAATWRNLLLAGGCVGGALASKYTGIVGAAPVIATAVSLAGNRRVRPSTSLAMVVASASACVVGTFLTGPYLFLSLSDVLADVANEARPSHLGATSQGFLSSLSYYVFTAGPAAIGAGVCLLALAGAALSFRRPVGVVALSFVVAYLLFVSSLNLTWHRWFIPVIPFAIIFGAMAVDQLVRWAGLRRSRQLVTLLLAAALTLPTVLTGIEVARTRAFDRDTRVAALAWVEATIPKGTRVLLETDAPGISATDYAAFVVKDGAVLPWSELEQRSRVTGYYTYFGQWSRPAGDLVAAIRQRGIDYVIMSDWADRFQLEAAAYPHELDVYIELQRAFPVVRQFVPVAGWSGPRISIRAVE